jgi:anti-sigma factor RsiW
MSEREPTADELLAMAYVDGELAPQERARFEQRLRGEPELAREVSELRRLELLARQAAPPEPMDHEWERLARSSGQRGLWSAGWLFFGAGLLGLAAWALACLEFSQASWVPKLLVPLALLGALLLVVAAVRARARTLRYDPYRDVKR